MSPLKTSLIVALVSGALTAGALFYFHQGRIREVRHLRYQNDRMRLEALQRNAARGVAAKPATFTADTRSGRSATAKPAPKPAEYYRNEGNATPLATLQTFAWACDRGDTGAVGRLLYIDATARPKVEAFMASLPEDVRAQWKTVDEMAAAILTESIMARPFPNADILETATPEPVSEDRIKMRLPNVPKDGTEYQKTPEGWKFAITEEMVDDFINKKTSPTALKRFQTM